MNFFRSLTIETHLAIFACSILLFFVTSSAVSFVQATPAKADVPSSYTRDDPLIFNEPAPDDSYSSDEPTESRSDDMDESPAASGPNETPEPSPIGWWRVISDFFSSLLFHFS